MLHVWLSGSFPAGSFFKNNICVLNRVSTLGVNLYVRSTGLTDQTNVMFTNNLYFGGSDRWYPNGVLYNSLAAAQAAGWEANSKADQDPLLTNPGAGGTCSWTPALANGPQPCPSAYRLRPGSPALGAGANLTATPLTRTRAGEIIKAIPPRPILALISSRWCKPYFALNVSTGSEGPQIADEGITAPEGDGRARGKSLRINFANVQSREALIRNGHQVGFDFDFSTPYQRIVWSVDEFDTLRREFLAMEALLDGLPG
jgi:hypothetical protein